MRIGIFRHGIAIDRDHPECPDEADRFLTEIGVKKTRRAARGIATLGLVPDAIISSPFVRAVQTAELAAEALAFDGEIELDKSLMWMKPPERVVAKLKDRDEGCILLVGHAPHLDDLIAHLVGARRAFTSMKKAALVEVECFDMRGGGGVLISHYPPRALRALGGAR